MKFLLEAAGNTLSHVARCLAIREALLARGHEVVLAASAARSAFLRDLRVDHAVLPDIQEADGGSGPGFAWFRPARFEACVRAEADLLARVRPDRVLGVFRFTGPLSARLAGVPYDSLVCGCMTPACEETLGFAPGEPGEAEQAAALRFFRRTTAARLSTALAKLGLAPVEDVWDLLVGERTFLWDVPEFQPLRPFPGIRHVGPVEWTEWPVDRDAPARLERLRDPLAVVSFGTSPGHRRPAERIVDVLARLGFSVAVAAGGQCDGDWPSPGPRFAAFHFLPVPQALRRAAVLACHGGQGIVLGALRQRVPVLVLPFQPEQAQNGRCLERLGCGLPLAHGEVFLPGAEPAEEVFLRRPLAELERDVARFLGDPARRARREDASRAVQRSGGVAALAAALEDAR